jgi:thiaminase
MVVKMATLYLDYIDTYKIKKINKPITWIINMMNQCIRDEKLKY